MVQEEQNKQQKASDMEWLEEKGRLQERPFSSSVPLIGPLIAGFRALWNSVAAKWTVRSLIEQQNEFNALLIQRMGYLESQVYAQIIEQDRAQTRLNRETAELGLQLAHMNRLLQALEERLAPVEEDEGVEGD
jgi:hypothetical protein